MKQLNTLFWGTPETNTPDNTKLLKLLEICRRENGERGSYRNVMDELVNGNSFLMLPTQTDIHTDPDKWTMAEKDATIKLASIVNLEGLNVLGAFTDEQALLEWTKKPSQYIAMRSQEILKFVQSRGMNRIVINNEQPTMFVLEQSRENVQEQKNQEETKVYFKTPDKPLSNSITKKLIANFRKNSIISEVYQYGQTKEGEYSLVLGFVLFTNTDNAKKSAINAVQNALQNEVVDQLLDLFFIETQSLYNSISRMENVLLYKKQDH